MICESLTTSSSLDSRPSATTDIMWSPSARFARSLVSYPFICWQLWSDRKWTLRLPIQSLSMTFKAEHCSRNGSPRVIQLVLRSQHKAVVSSTGWTPAKFWSGIWPLAPKSNQTQSVNKVAKVVHSLLVCRYTLSGHTAAPDILQATENHNLFLSYNSAGDDPNIRIWELDSGETLTMFNLG